MTKRQRVRDKIRYIKRNYVLGAGRTAQLATLKQVYELGDGPLRGIAMFTSGCTYWA